jgi:hypothetical protein
MPSGSSNEVSAQFPGEVRESVLAGILGIVGRPGSVEAPLKEIRITVRCVREPQKHAKILRCKARLGKRKAEELAELLDGTSLMYIHRPGENSPMGKCATCGAAVEAMVSEIMDGEDEGPMSCGEAAEAIAQQEEEDNAVPAS